MMKKTIISLIIIIIMLFTININACAFTSTQKYYECTRWEIEKDELISENASNKGSGIKCSDTFKNDKKPVSITDCYEKVSSGFLGLGAKYNLYSASLRFKVYYKDSILPDYDNCSKDDVKTLNKCEDIGSNANLCAFYSSCSMQGGMCTSQSSWKDDNACSNINASGGGKTECEAIGCTWSNTSGCVGTATIKDSYHPDNQNIDSNVKTTQHADGVIVETNCNGIFGDFQDDLVQILKIFRILAPIIVAAFSVYEYLIAVINKDADALKKCNSRLLKRLILMAVLFLLPSLVNLLLKLVGDNYGVCLNTK